MSTKATQSSAKTRGRCRSAPRACSRRVMRYRIEAGPRGVQLLLLAGKPIGEPVVQYGPFVMNSVQEIERAIVDYQSGRLTVAS